MKHLKKLVALGMAMVLTAGLAACGGSGDGGSAEDVMKKAQDEMSKVKSMSYDMVMDMNMTMGDQKVETSTNGKIDFIADPLAMKMDMTMDMGAQGSYEMNMYAEKAGDEYVMYMTMDGTNWMKQTLADAAELEQYNAQDSMGLYLEGIENFKEAGTEKVNGSDATRYDGVISKDAMNDVMASSGAADQFAQLGISAAQAEEMYKDLGELPVSLWIDKESSLPVKYEMDMTGIMQKLMDKMMEAVGEQAAGLSISVDKMFISMTLSNFNKVEEIKVPDAAKNAQEGAF